MATKIIAVTEQKRLNEAREAGIPWKKWGITAPGSVRVTRRDWW